VCFRSEQSAAADTAYGLEPQRHRDTEVHREARKKGWPQINADEHKCVETMLSKAVYNVC